MEVIAKIGGSFLTGIIELITKRSIEKAQDHWLGSSSKLRSALQNIQRKFLIIKRRITHAEKRAYIDGDSASKAWMESLQDIVFYADKVLDAIEYKKLKEKFTKENRLRAYMLKYKPFSIFEYNMIEKLDEIEKKLDGLIQLANSYNLEVAVDQLNSNIYMNSQERTTISVFDGKIFGRDDIINHIIERLMQDNPTINEEHIISIVGMGGIGKTTLAQMVFNHEKVKGYFDLRIWVCVSNDFDERKIISQILESISYCLKEKGESEGSYANLDVLAQKLVDKLKEKRYFLILDDVWNENPSKWEKIENCLKIGDQNKGSKVLVTTRKKCVASIVSSSKPIHLDGLSDDVLWHILKTFVFGSIEEGPLELREILKKITGKLKGSPLAAKTVGYNLISNRDKRHWENILNSEIWALKQNEDDITSALMLSYQNLPGYLKPCFAFCSLYPKDYVYNKKKIVRMWMALGYIQEQSGKELMEEIGEDYIKELVDRSMFQACTEDDVQYIWEADASEWFKIHDLIHDVAEVVSGNNSLMIHDECTMKQLSSSVRNLSIDVYDEEWSWKGHDSFDDFNNVQTLILFLSKYIRSEKQLGGGFKDFMQKALPKMKFLRVLDLSEVFIYDYPVPKLKHLRYLKLNVGGDNLPSSLVYLYQLQVLEYVNMPAIGFLSKTPRPARQIRYSENLRHIRGIRFDTNADPFLGKFIFLQELDLSVSAKEEEDGYHGLKALRGMKWMRELSIRGLENVESKDEALEAELKSMDRLTKLTLEWNLDIPSRDNVEEILEALHRGPNIRVLEINGYGGAECPGWMESLSLLRELRFNGCSNMKFVRTRGLKMIKRLKLWFCHKLRVEAGFEGFGALNTLQELSIDACDRLAADLFTEGRGGLPCSLKELEITFRNSTPIINVSSTIMQSLTNLTQLKIWKGHSGISTSGSFMAPSPINPPESQQLQQLKRLDLNGEDVKGWLLYLRGCTALCYLSLCNCSGLLFDAETEDAFVSFVSLRRLDITGWNISCIPLEKVLRGGLQILEIYHSPLLQAYVRKVRHELNDWGWDVEAHTFGGIRIKRNTIWLE